MGKYELRRKMIYAEDEIDCLNTENGRLKSLIDLLNGELAETGDLRALAESFYEEKRRKNVCLTGIKGRANDSVVRKYSEMFGNSDAEYVMQEYNGIIGIINSNIHKAKDRIAGNNRRMEELKARIRGWGLEILDIEKKEEERCRVTTD